MLRLALVRAAPDFALAFFRLLRWLEILSAERRVRSFMVLGHHRVALRPDNSCCSRRFGETQDMSFAVTSATAAAWVDVLVDTDMAVQEINEDNNHSEAYLTFPDCSFN